MYLIAACAICVNADAQSTSGSQQKTPSQTAGSSTGIVIDTTSLPITHPQTQYTIRLHSRGGVAPYHWKLQGGDLPAGIKLEDDGTLHGAAQRPGDYHFTISVRDSSVTPAVQLEYVLHVVTAIAMQWKVPVHVSGSRIEGSVAVTNTTTDDFDFTFVVLAVAGDGRATAIGYQHFPLTKGTIDFEIPFGENLAHGAYVVHVDGVGEIAEKSEIQRARLQTLRPLQVTVGP